jgi:4,5-dihydroxyphthalate decarboxylase
MNASLILFSRYYDRVAPLLDGRVRVGRKAVRFEVMSGAPQAFRRMMEDSDVLAGEMSLGFQTAAASAQEPSRFLAIPVFLSRAFRHGNVFVLRESELTNFAQLRGQRVALEEYAMTMAVWLRALFESSGVMPDQIHWVTGRDPIVVPQVEATLRKCVNLERISGESIWSLLQQRRVDAVIGRPPNPGDVDPDGAYRRLLPNHWKHQREYYAATKIFPIMHVLVVRRDVYELDPQIALDLYEAFETSKRLVADDMLTNLNALTVTLPMLESHLDETKALFGADWWPYGIARNLTAIRAFTSYCFNQGLTPEPVKIEDLFCRNTLQL